VGTFGDRRLVKGMLEGVVAALGGSGWGSGVVALSPFLRRVSWTRRAPGVPVRW